MSTLELNLFAVLKKELQLSDEKAMRIVEAFDKTQKETINNFIVEYKSELKEDFAKVDLRFENVNTKFEQVFTKIEMSKSDTLKWFMGGFITLVLMVLGLYATILLK